MNVKVLADIDSLSDEVIVQHVVNGEVYLYETLMRRLNTRLYRVSFSIIGDDMEAEDIMQNTYIYAYNNLKKFDNRARFSTWITRILINECLLRKKKLMRRQLIYEDQKNNDTVMQTPLNNLLNKELKTLMETAIATLPEKYRTVFIMREIEEMSTNETMEILNIEESNVKIRLMRAKSLLRIQLSNYYKQTELFEFHLIRCNKVTSYVMHQINNNI
jgi:RNA polymerase sigma factor (sigma-70 family)